MERGQQGEAVFEYTPELSTSQRPAIGGVKSSVALSSRGAAGAVSILRENETIDTSAVNVAKARDIFSAKEADAEDIAMAEQHRRARPMGATAATRVAAALEAQEAKASGVGAPTETPDQRCSRLHVELASVARTAEASSPEVATELLGADPKVVLAELRVMEQKLRAWRKVVGNSHVDQATGIGAMRATVGDVLDRLTTGGRDVAEGKVALTGNEMTWELNYVPSVEVAANGSRLAALESSLAEMTKKIGSFEASSHFADLQSAMAHVHSRLALLDSQKLEAIRNGAEKAKLGLDTCLANKQEKTKSLDIVTNEEVCSLHDHCHRFFSTAGSLPAIVSRLQSLQSLHQMEASFVSRLAALESQQDEMTKLLEVTNSAVRDMQVGMKENMATMQANIKTLEARLSKGKG
mmetsp:Transcript_39529/g.113770  ORF Transcript_39529/g.113770 Transcript_39529/m.113770 type:complete len:409 (-) Transcript_39529:84-1310(-)